MRVISGTIKIECMEKSRKRDNILIVVINVALFVAFIVIHNSEKWKPLKMICLLGYLILTIVYFVCVVFILYPAVKRI